MNKSESCSSCRFWCFSGKTELGGHFGECRKNPPILLTDRSDWPKSYAHDWCGEFLSPTLT